MIKSAIPGLLAVLLCIGAARADDGGALSDRLTVSGWLETVQSMRLSPPNDQVTSRAKLRLETSADLDLFYAFVSADAEKNWTIPSETGVDLHEAWLEYVGSGWDLRLGRQIIIWGKADGVQITDIISPPDFTESMTRDLDEIRMPVDATRVRLLGRWVDTELIWIPVFKSAIAPVGDNPWAASRPVPETMRISSETTEKPASNLENSEIAMKVSAYLPGFDVAASIFHVWDDYATRHRTAFSENGTLHVDYDPKHHRLTILGLECSRPWSDFVFRGEAAYAFGQYRETNSVFEDPRKKDGLKWLAGLDWTPGNDWTVTTQLIGAHIVDHDPELIDGEFSSMATINVSKKLLRQTLTLSDMLYWDLDRGDYFNRAKAEYALTDSLHLTAGLDLFGGPAGRFGQYEDNRQLWLRLKYSF